MAETRVCKKCQKDLPLTDFYFRKEKNDYRGCCKKCKSVNTKEEIANRLLSPTKVCTHCNINKPVSEYQKAGAGRWLQPYCKPCDSERKKKYVEKNKEKVLSHRKDYYESNRRKIIERCKEYRENNLALVKKRAKAYAYKNREQKRINDREYRRLNKHRIYSVQKIKRDENPEYYKYKAKLQRLKRTPDQNAILAQKGKEYRKKNKEKYMANRKKYLPIKREKDRLKARVLSATSPEFKILKNLRSRIHVALKRGIKKSDTTKNLLGCTIPEFREYFASLFTEGMTWEKYMDGEIHIDHIKPCSRFDLTKEEDQRRCFHYSNLQPLWQLDNLLKGDYFKENNIIYERTCGAKKTT